jgi:hypothetical protein
METERGSLVNWLRSTYVCLGVALAIGCYTGGAVSQAGSGRPIKYISGCEIDLSNDGRTDIVLLIETSRGRELVVLMKTDEGYKAYQLPTPGPAMNLSCRIGSTVTETTAGKKVGTEAHVHTTPGAYVELKMPEGSSVVYYWKEGWFSEVWTSD